MKYIIEFFKGFNGQEIISLIAVVWLMTNTKFKKINEKLNENSQDIKRFDTRLSRLEGRFEERSN